MNPEEDRHTFWWHLDELRTVLIRISLVSVLCGIVAFLFKEEVFSIVLAPKSQDFVTYRVLERISSLWGGTGFDKFNVQLINTGLAQQFIIHMKTAFCVGIIAVSPYILYELFAFVAPALYRNERKYGLRVVWAGYIMFFMGILLNYFVIFPLTFRFLGTYQVAGEVSNLISLESYMSTLAVMSIWLGIMFELPVVAWLLSRAGVIDSGLLGRYRKHAIVAILIIAAVITPTSDVFTLMLVSVPIYLLYELSIIVIKAGGKSESPKD